MNRAEQFVRTVKTYRDGIADKEESLRKLQEARPSTNVGIYNFGIDDQGCPTISHPTTCSSTSFEPRRLQDWLDHWFGDHEGDGR